MVDYGILMAVVLAGVGAVVEVVRLEGRLNGHDTLFVEREKLTEATHKDLTARLVRIETKLDESLKLNGSSTQ
mgnify:CR=1 FL=1